MTEETSEVRARGQESQQPQEEVTLRSLMDFMREVRREQNEKFEKQKEETNENLKVINDKFDQQNENIAVIKENLEENRTRNSTK